MTHVSLKLLCLFVGLELNDIQLCLNWMQPCATVLSQKGPVLQKTFSGVCILACLTLFIQCVWVHVNIT